MRKRKKKRARDRKNVFIKTQLYHPSTVEDHTVEDEVLTPGALYWHRDATHANQSKHGPNIYKDTKL